MFVAASIFSLSFGTSDLCYDTQFCFVLALLIFFLSALIAVIAISWFSFGNGGGAIVSDAPINKGSPVIGSLINPSVCREYP